MKTNLIVWLYTLQIPVLLGPIGRGFVKKKKKKKGSGQNKMIIYRYIVLSKIFKISSTLFQKHTIDRALKESLIKNYQSVLKRMALDFIGKSLLQTL